MSQDQVHYELFIRRNINAPWTLDCAGEDRQRVVSQAEELLAEGRVVAIKVTKERMDPETGAFKSVNILSKGLVDLPKRRRTAEPEEAALCVAPADLYTVHARERIGRLLPGWLARHGVTVFELLHRPDLVETLDASGTDLQHALQKLAVPEAQHRGVGVHEVMRSFHKLVERAVERLIKDGRNGAFPMATPDNFAATAERLADNPDRAYYLGGSVAGYLAFAETARDKIGRILDLAENAPAAGRPRALALYVLEQPLAELLGSRGGLSDLLGEELDLGASLAALTRLAAGPAVASLEPYDPLISRWIPPLEGEARRLADWLEREAFEDTRGAISRRILNELMGPRRLKPGDADGEIATLRALAMALTAGSGNLLPLDDVQEAFVERSRTLVAGDFVTAFLAEHSGPVAEAHALLRLAENVVGGANKRSAARWLAARISSLKFETDLRSARESPLARLAALAELQRAAGRVGMQEAEQASVVNKLGEIGGLIEADAKLLHGVARAAIPLQQRLMMLLKLAAGEGAPLGPVTERARIEAIRLVKTPETRAELAAHPEVLEPMRALMVSAGVAA